MNSIPWYKSGVYVGALVTIIMQVAVIFGFADQISEGEVTKSVEAVMEIISLGAAGWALYSRHRSQVQPITLTKKE